MRRYMKLVAAAVLAVSVLAGCQQSAGESSTQAATETVRETESSAEAPEGSQAKGSAETSDGAASELDLAAAAGKHHVVITVKDYGGEFSATCHVVVTDGEEEQGGCGAFAAGGAIPAVPVLSVAVLALIKRRRGNGR